MIKACNYGDTCNLPATHDVEDDDGEPHGAMCTAHARYVETHHEARIKRTREIWTGVLAPVETSGSWSAIWRLVGPHGLRCVVRYDHANRTASATFTSSRKTSTDHIRASAEAHRMISSILDLVADASDDAHRDAREPQPVVELDGFHAGPSPNGSRVEIAGADALIFVGAFFVDELDPDDSIDLVDTFRRAVALEEAADLPPAEERTP